MPGFFATDALDTGNVLTVSLLTDHVFITVPLRGKPQTTKSVRSTEGPCVIP